MLSPSAEVAQRVRIVSFFITARLAAQDTREAFIQVVLEQLAGLLGQPLPPVLPEATREALLLDLMSQAAASCAEAGRRLVLVVDGLDEDRGVTLARTHTASLGCCPQTRPHGMRVIVAAGQSPGPRRRTGLAPAARPRDHPAAGASPVCGRRAAAEQPGTERLLRGTRGSGSAWTAAAARGGLSAQDLEELTDLPRWDIEEILHTATGRTFTAGPAAALPEHSRKPTC